MKILIAEDDAYTRDGLVEVLEAEGHIAVAASTGAEALRLYKEERPDFVCLDIMMPEINGYEVCRDIRKHDSTVPVLFISAKSEEIDKVVGLEIGADDYIVKPFGVREVLARINAIVRRSGNSDQDTDVEFSLKDLRIAPAELRGYRGSDSFELSTRDVRLLSLFAQNPGKVLSRDDLFDVGWGVDYLPSSRSLDQYISQLRKKIEIDAKNPKIIVTVHAAGYRFPG